MFMWLVSFNRPRNNPVVFTAGPAIDKPCQKSLDEYLVLAEKDLKKDASYFIDRGIGYILLHNACAARGK